MTLAPDLPGVPDSPHVLVTYLGYGNERRRLVLTLDQAREHFKRLPEPLKASYVIADLPADPPGHPDPPLPELLE